MIELDKKIRPDIHMFTHKKTAESISTKLLMKMFTEASNCFLSHANSYEARVV